MSYFKNILAGAACAAAAIFTAGAKSSPSVLEIANHLNDSTVVFPESFETDTHKLLQNWYLQTYTALDQSSDVRPDVNVTDQELIKRLGAIPTTIELPFNSIVRQYIDLYTQKRRALVETMLGMSLYYMPIFEEALDRQGLPHELKYLPIIESALDPNAVSRAGATGLWQLMIPTARGLGIEINTLVDERRDPYRSTDVATTYLKQLYDIYHDWSLAIAAYNCGPGNVNKALRRAGASEDNHEKKDYWAIYPYLPAETRGYLPGFIAATYVMNFYKQHNISPALAKRPIITDSVHVNKRVNFQQIADVLQIPIEEIQILNPQYRQNVIPGDIRSCSLVLPANQIYSYIMSEDAIVKHNADQYARREVVEPATEEQLQADAQSDGEWVTTEQVTYHKVKRGETLTSIARRYGMTLSALRKANGNVSKARRGRKLKVITTKRVFRPAEKSAEPTPDDKLLVKNDAAAEIATEVAPAAETAPAETAVATETAAQLPENTAATAPAAAATAAEQPETAEVSEAESKVAGSFQASNKKKEAQAAAEAAARKAAAAKAAEEAKAADTGVETAEEKAAPAKAKSTKSNKKSTSKKSGTKTVTVKAGDTLEKIARRNGTTVKKLERLNGKKKLIHPGDKIRVK